MRAEGAGACCPPLPSPACTLWFMHLACRAARLVGLLIDTVVMQQIRMSGDRLDIIKKGQKGLEVKAAVQKCINSAGSNMCG